MPLGSNDLACQCFGKEQESLLTLEALERVSETCVVNP